MRNILVFMIRGYQRLLSPDKGLIGRQLARGSVCTMYPTCSEYAIISIQKHGSLKGSIKSVRRVFRCHPWQKKLIDLP